MWERSGQFEGDIMLTEEQQRIGLINTARRWPQRTLPFFIDPVFSKYCNIKIEYAMLGMEGIIHAFFSPL
jgi:hypothetical protein